MLAVAEDVLVPFPGPPEKLGACTEVRSTLITLSIEALRARGRLDRYRSVLPVRHRDELLSSVAGT